MDPTTGEVLKNLLTVAWLLPLLGFVAEIYWLRWSHRLSKSAAFCAVACIGIGFLCSVSALLVWVNATGWAVHAPVDHGGSGHSATHDWHGTQDSHDEAAHSEAVESHPGDAPVDAEVPLVAEAANHGHGEAHAHAESTHRP